MTQTQTPARSAWARLFPACTMTAAKAEARALGVTVRPDPLGPCLDGGRLLEVFPKGQGSRAVPADDPAEAVFLARAWALDESANRFGFGGPSMDSKARVIVAAALDARGVGSEGVSLTLNFTSGPSASAEVLATLDGANGRVSARFHEFTRPGLLALAAEELAETLAARFMGDIEGIPLHDLTRANRARFWRLESARLRALGVNEATADSARMAEALGDSFRSSGPRFYRDAAEAFRAGAALFSMAAGQCAGHAKRARFQEAAERLTRRADSAEVDSWPHATPEAAPIDPAEGLGFGVETVTESGPVSIGAGVMEPEPTPEAAPVSTSAERKAAETLARMESDAAEVWAEGRGAWIHVLGLDCVATGPDSWVYHDGGPAGLTSEGMTRAAALAFLSAAFADLESEGFGVPAPEAAPEAAPVRVRVLDMTPTWAGLLPAFRAVLENGTPEGVAMVWAELARMAEAADSAVAAEARAKAEERAQIEAARAAEAEAVGALSDIMAPRPCHLTQEAEATLDAGAVARAERASMAAEPLTQPGQAPEAQTTAVRAQNAAEAVKELAGARSAVRAAKRAAQPPASGFSLAHEFGPRHWQGKAAEAFRKAAEFAAVAGLTDPAAILTHAAEVAARKAEPFDGMATTRA